MRLAAQGTSLELELEYLAFNKTATRCGASQHGLHSKKLTLITSECGAKRSLRIKRP